MSASAREIFIAPVKRLIVVNGPAGVGKTAVCRELYQRLDRCAWLDGDWCWTMHPFAVTDETKRMVEENVVSVLANFLACSEVESVVFCWVLHREEILERLLSRLRDARDGKRRVPPFAVSRFTLLCDEEALRARMSRDGRAAEVIETSVRRLPLYRATASHRIDTADRPMLAVVEEILNALKGGSCA